jgi:ATP-dependent RNA helicase SUPV3L1/SUV3
LELGLIKTSQALQIAGRAGRFNTQFSNGYVTTFNKSDLPILKQILSQPLEKTSKAGLLPTTNQIELFAYHLPDLKLSNLLSIYANICTVDTSHYFLCRYETVIKLAEKIDHLPIKIKAKYLFCLSPIDEKEPLSVHCFVTFARCFSSNEPVSVNALKKLLGYPLTMPCKIDEIRHLEVVYDVLELYLWLGTRFAEIFPHAEEIKQMRKDLGKLIDTGVKEMSSLNFQGRQAVSRNSPLYLSPSKSVLHDDVRVRSMYDANKSIAQGQRSTSTPPLRLEK